MGEGIGYLTGYDFDAVPDFSSDIRFTRQPVIEGRTVWKIHDHDGAVHFSIVIHHRGADQLVARCHRLRAGFQMRIACGHAAVQCAVICSIMADDNELGHGLRPAFEDVFCKFFEHSGTAVENLQMAAGLAHQHFGAALGLFFAHRGYEG